MGGTSDSVLRFADLLLLEFIQNVHRLLLEGFGFLLILVEVIWEEEQIFAALLLYLAYEELVDGEEEERTVVDHHILLDSLLRR